MITRDPRGGRQPQKCHCRPVQLEEHGAEPRRWPRPPCTVSRPAFRRRPREVPMPARALSHPGLSHPGLSHPGLAGSRHGRQAARLPAVPSPPLPDPDAVRLCPIPDSLRRTTTSCYRVPPGPRPQAAGRGPAGQDQDGGQRDQAAGPDHTSGRTRAPGQRRPGTGSRPARTRRLPRVHRSPGRRRLARPVRSGAGGDAGRVQAATADLELATERAGPGSSASARCSRPASGPSCAGWWPSGPRPT